MTDWKAHAEREAAAVLDSIAYPGAGYYSRDKMIGMLALAWLQGASYGMHDALNAVDGTFEEMRAEA